MRPWIEITPKIRITGTGAAWLPDTQTIVISDLHIGYSRAARRRGGYLPNAEAPEQLASRVLQIVADCFATHLIIAGDLRHSTRDVDQGELQDIATFLDGLSAVPHLEIIAGNHDRAMPGTVPSVVMDDITIMHTPPNKNSSEEPHWTICGHVHPVATIRDATGAAARYPCFLVSERMVVLPAFTEWAGGLRGSRLFTQLPAAIWRRFIINDGLVFNNL